MKHHVKLFEEFLLTNPAEELSLKKQFTTSAVTANVPITRSVSTIVSDKDGTRTVIGDKSQTSVIITIENPEEN